MSSRGFENIPSFYNTAVFSSNTTTSLNFQSQDSHIITLTANSVNLNNIGAFSFIKDDKREIKIETDGSVKLIGDFKNLDDISKFFWTQISTVFRHDLIKATDENILLKNELISVLNKLKKVKIECLNFSDLDSEIISIQDRIDSLSSGKD